MFEIRECVRCKDTIFYETKPNWSLLQELHGYLFLSGPATRRYRDPSFKIIILIREDDVCLTEYNDKVQVEVDK